MPKRIIAISHKVSRTTLYCVIVLILNAHDIAASDVGTYSIGMFKIHYGCCSRLIFCISHFLALILHIQNAKTCTIIKRAFLTKHVQGKIKNKPRFVALLCEY